MISTQDYVQFAIFKRHLDNREIILNLANVISIIPGTTDKLHIRFIGGLTEVVVGSIENIKRPLTEHK